MESYLVSYAKKAGMTPYQNSKGSLQEHSFIDDIKVLKFKPASDDEGNKENKYPRHTSIDDKMPSKRKIGPANNTRQSKRRVTTSQQRLTNSSSSLGLSQTTSDATVQPTPNMHTDQQQPISGSLLDQIVARVTREVTDQLAPIIASSTSTTTTMMQGNLTAPVAATQALVETPVCNPVLASVDDVHQHLTGEPQVRPTLPSSIFSSLALPVDARVTEKMKGKIWSHEYIDFGSLRPYHREKNGSRVSNATHKNLAVHEAIGL
ncbi:hypothetical protein QZH41_004408 [Actinostola sp. cb2023]|nr:hypothetical protein QZH41_004408 [Actinostola sp. cb2023]